VSEFATTLHYPLRPAWNARAEVLTADDPMPTTLVRRVLHAAAEHRVLVLNGFGRADLVAAAMIARMRRRPRLIITDCTWSVGESRLDRLRTRASFRAVDGNHVTYCVLTKDELETFPHSWDVPRSRVRLCPWYHGLDADDLAKPSSEDGPVFTGGRSFRDYRALLSIGTELPLPVTVAATPDSLPGGYPLPSALEVGEVPHATYLERMRRARAVLVPLAERWDRGAGQTTYLTAMAMGKLVIVTDTLGVRDVVRDRETGIIVRPNDPVDLLDALRWLADDKNLAEIRAIGRRARALVIDEYGPDRYVSRLLSMVDEYSR
jgi:hypothetical protein